MDLLTEYLPPEQTAPPVEQPAPPKKKPAAPVPKDEAPDVRMASDEQVARLVSGWLYREESAKKLTYEKAGLLLNKLQRQASVTIRRAAAVARNLDGDKDTPPAASQRWLTESRDTYAAGVREMARAGGDELTNAVAWGLWALDEYELRFLAAEIVRMLEGGER